MLINLNNTLFKIKYLFSLTCFISCFNVNNNQIKSIDILELSKFSNFDNVTLLDVRTDEEIKNGCLFNSTHIDYYDENFLYKINLLNKNNPIYIYCKVGGRSSKAAEKILNAGFKNVYNLQGGFLKWSQQKLPVQLNNKISLSSSSEKYSFQYLDSLKANNSNTLIYISTKWCAPCREMSPLIEELENEFSEKLEIVKFDLDENNFLNQTYNISSIPMFVLYQNSEEVWRKNGIIAYDEIVRKIKSYNSY